MTLVIAMLGLVGIAVVGAPMIAAAAGATLYVLTENMKLVPKQQTLESTNRRIGTSPLAGKAYVGTPLCPSQDLAGADKQECAVNALGTDDVSLATGLGTLSGQFTTVIEGDNPVDGPEAVVLRGTFNGHMDFSPAILGQIPYGTFVGKVRASGGPNTDFTGVFRLPFAGNVEVEVKGVTMTLRQLFCPLSPNPNPYTSSMYGGFDLAYLDFDAGQPTPNGRCLDIQPTELSLGAPLVRFDVEF